jgi:mannose-6-phosphate isomerase-like protein (cupin superfamily)
MSTDRKSTRSAGEKLGRRTALKRSLAGGAGLLAIVGRGIEPISAEPGLQPPATVRPPALTGRVRRVITGHNAKGRSCVVSDEVVDVGSLWISSAAQPLGGPAIAAQGGGYRVGPSPAGEPGGLLPSDAPNVDPPLGGTRLSISTIAPTKGTKPAVDNREGRHRTHTIDYGFVLNGKLVCVLDEQEVALNAGDVIIQRNTDHAWRNDGTEGVRVLFTIVRIQA